MDDALWCPLPVDTPEAPGQLCDQDFGHTPPCSIRWFGKTITAPLDPTKEGTPA